MTSFGPSDAVVRTDDQPWDLLVVGGGTAGLVAATTAADLGASVLMVEKDRTGGDCLWTGCVPSKALLAAAHAAANARAAASLGIHVDGVRVDFAAVMAHVRSAITAIAPVDSPDAVRASGAAVAQGTVRFTGPGSATIDGEPIRFLQAVLASGSTPAVPDISGLDEADPLTSDTVWDLDVLPPRLLVLGGGSIGCELGQALARLGSQVTLVEAAERLLPAESAEAAAVLAAALGVDGVDVHTGCSVHRVEREGAAYAVQLADSAGDRDSIIVDRVLVATGRRPCTGDLGLDLAGVATRDSGHVVVDGHLRTSNPRIWAAGDLTGHPAFTHTAGVHGSLAASNAVLGLRRPVAADLVPRVTYTQPEVASFGLPPGPGRTVRTVSHTEVDRAVAQDDTSGFSTLVLGDRGRIVGATIVGPRAGETLAETVLAAQEGLSARSLAGVMHAYPTWSDAVWKTALAQTRADLGSPAVRRAIGLLISGRRRWMSVRRSSGTSATAPDPAR